MRRAVFILAAVAAVVTCAAMGTETARAETVYPFCTTPTWAEGLDCDYRTFEQCVAANAGISTTCVANPRYTGPQTDFTPAPAKRRRR